MTPSTISDATTLPFLSIVIKQDKVNRSSPSFNEQMPLDKALGSAVPMFQNPTVQFGAVIGCNVIMVLAGVIAGYVPAKRAVSIKLVDALTS